MSCCNSARARAAREASRSGKAESRPTTTLNLRRKIRYFVTVDGEEHVFDTQQQARKFATEHGTTWEQRRVPV